MEWDGTSMRAYYLEFLKESINEKGITLFSFVLFWFGFNRGHYEVLTGSSVEAMSIPFTRSLL